MDSRSKGAGRGGPWERRTEHVGVGVGVASGSLEKCGIDPNDVYQLSFYIFILGVVRKFNYEQHIRLLKSKI